MYKIKIIEDAVKEEWNSNLLKSNINYIKKC